MSTIKSATMDLDFIMRLEGGEPITHEELYEAYADGIRTGLVWKLQGSYGRTARDLILSGLISPDGVITEKGHEEIASLS